MHEHLRVICALHSLILKHGGLFYTILLFCACPHPSLSTHSLSLPQPHFLDYRSPTGSFSRGFKPMVHDEFITQQVKRSRYWARSMLGYHRFSEAKPNEGHRALAALEKDLKMLGLLISQNVDVRL